MTTREWAGVVATAVLILVWLYTFCAFLFALGPVPA